MTIPAFPVTLPQNLLISGYSQGLANNLITSQPDVGPAKIRRRTTSNVRPLKGSMTLTKTQLATLISFYEDDLIGGSLRFSWTDPVDDSAIEARFVSSPSWTAQSTELFSVNIDLEILP